jgi:hypothetical protein
MTHTVDTLMAIADAYAISVADAPHHPTPLLRAMAVEKIERAREALRKALTEALSPQLPIPPDSRELEQAAQPVHGKEEFANRLRRLCGLFSSDHPESALAQKEFIRDFSPKTKALAQPVREPLTDKTIEVLTVKVLE